MLSGSIQISGETLSSAEVKDICDSLRTNSVRLLSLRGCHISDRDFHRISRHVADCQSLAQLNLNLGVVSNINRVKQLAEALASNRSIHSLLYMMTNLWSRWGLNLDLLTQSLHGTPLTDSGLAVLNPVLSLHPSLISLDLGDCILGDEGMNLICGLLPPDGAKSGLKELTLSANPAVTVKGWARLAIAVAHSSQLRVLNLDYNPLGDHIAGMLAVAVASSRTLEVVDLEGTGLTNQSAQIFLDMVENYPTSIRTLILAENNISLELQQQISDLLSEGEEEEETENEGQEDAGRQKEIWIAQSNPESQAILVSTQLEDSLLAETEM
ncbi:leucine-rich repeat-containing protein 73 isoform X1 [Stegostoma tigrinum]|uniref:leucine-rich repeat-containing protein 73 isoform X1 n=1 Tax=Stegostoma tigrinum TaxID=3053191 RepID=UPI00286FDCBF|nr:leucine-rich repeat-containing protein 73 isoform X1 [Stegostoma tigrinum]